MLVPQIFFSPFKQTGPRGMSKAFTPSGRITITLLELEEARSINSDIR